MSERIFVTGGCGVNGSWVVRDFRFHNGQVLPELRLAGTVSRIVPTVDRSKATVKVAIPTVRNFMTVSRRRRRQARAAEARLADNRRATRRCIGRG